MADYENDIKNGIEGIKDEIGKIKNKNARMGAVISAIAVVAVLVGAIIGVYIGQNWNSFLPTVVPEVSSGETVSMIEERLEKEAKLITASDTITARYDSGKIYRTVMGQKIPLSSKSFSFTYTGVVEAGVKDLSLALVEVDASAKKIKISLPKAEITNKSLNTDNINNTEQTKNFFNQITIEDFNNAQESLKKTMVHQAIVNGILDKAQENAEQVLKDLLKDITEGYEMSFEWFAMPERSVETTTSTTSTTSATMTSTQAE